MKTTNRVLAKFLGARSGSPEGTFIVTIIIGLVQTICGFYGVIFRKQKLFSNWRQILGSITFGFLASVMTVLGILIFTYQGADVGVVTFIVSLSIVPGIFFDRIFFGDKLILRQYIGVLLFLFAGWAVLGFISLGAFLTLPMWVLITLCLMFLYPVNELITRKLAVREKVDPFVNNFWIGVSTIAFSILGLSLFGERGLNIHVYFSNIFLLTSVTMGFVVVLMISFKLIAYKDGSTIALKKLVMQGIHLVSALFAGVLIFGEALTLGKIIGVFVFFVAFSLADKTTWKAICSLVQKWVGDNGLT